MKRLALCFAVAATFSIPALSTIDIVEIVDDTYDGTPIGYCFCGVSLKEGANFYEVYADDLLQSKLFVKIPSSYPFADACKAMNGTPLIAHPNIKIVTVQAQVLRVTDGSTALTLQKCAKSVQPLEPIRFIREEPVSTGSPTEPVTSSSPAPSESSAPSASESPAPSESPVASESPAPSESPAASESPAPSESP